jgi:hypothetical protein
MDTGGGKSLPTGYADTPYYGRGKCSKIFVRRKK